MVQVPEELKPYVNGNKLCIQDGAIHDLEKVAAYLKDQKNLTHIAISEDVILPKQANGALGSQVLAVAVSRGQSPNILEVSIAGGHSHADLAALTDGNRRSAIDLLTKAKDTSHALSSRGECVQIQKQLPAMLAIAEDHGPFGSEHSMTNFQLADTLERIRDHAVQHDVDLGVQEHIDRLRPVTKINGATRQPIFVGHMGNQL